MRYFCGLLVVIAATIGPFWHASQVMGDFCDPLDQWSQQDCTSLTVEPTEYKPQRPVPTRESRALMAVVGESRLYQENLGPDRPWIGDQLDVALKSRRVCNTIPEHAGASDAVLTPSGQQDRPWWMWIELYEGRFTCSTRGIKKDLCFYISADHSRATCFMKFFRIRMNYMWRAAYMDPPHRDPLVLIEGGNVKATARSLMANMELKRHPDSGLFYISELFLRSVEVDKIIFQHPTVGWYKKTIRTRDQSFRNMFRTALANGAGAFIRGPLLGALKREFADARNKTLDMPHIDG